MFLYHGLLLTIDNIYSLLLRSIVEKYRVDDLERERGAEPKGTTSLTSSINVDITHIYSHLTCRLQFVCRKCWLERIPHRLVSIEKRTRRTDKRKNSMPRYQRDCSFVLHRLSSLSSFFRPGDCWPFLFFPSSCTSQAPVKTSLH